jgi:hypothetical protein
MNKPKISQSSLLYLITCSNHKQKGGSSEYDNSDSLINSLNRTKKQDLMELRKFVFRYIKSGSFSRAGRKLIDLPYNKGLTEGPDFGKNSGGIYLKARERYAGRLYREISEGSWINRKHHVLILSGLYGLLTPEEYIQLYSLHLKDSHIIYEIWENDITSILLNYMKFFSIATVVDLTAENLYRRVINWAKIKQSANVFHAFGDQNVGPSLLESIGSFFREQRIHRK